MNSILVTGGAGFIGVAFVRHLLSDPQVRVINLDKLTYAGNLESLGDLLQHERHIFVHGDICDRVLVTKLLSDHQISAVAHLAAESHVDRSIDGPATFLETNVLGTFTLLDSSLSYWTGLSGPLRDDFRFLQVSTDEVYGSLGPSGAFTEESPFQPNSPYSASKASADHFVRAYFNTFGLPVLTTNCSNNYGPFQFPDKLIPRMILAAMEGATLPVYGDGEQRRDWLFVDDHCDALRCVLERGVPGKVYNVGGSCEMSNLEVVTAICRTMDELVPGLPVVPCESLIRFVEDRPGHDRRYAIDSGRIQRELGWRPGTSFSEGLKKTVQWYLANDNWSKRVAERGMYGGERLGTRSAP